MSEPKQSYSKERSNPSPSKGFHQMTTGPDPVYYNGKMIDPEDPAILFPVEVRYEKLS